MLGTYSDHLGAMRGQGAAANRPGNHLGQIQDPHTGQRPLGIFGQPLWWRLADLDQLEHRQPGNRLGLGVRLPFLRRADQRYTKPVLAASGLQRQPIPLGHRPLNLGPVVVTAQNL